MSNTLAALLQRIDAEWTKDSHAEGWYAFFAARLAADNVIVLTPETLAEALHKQHGIATEDPTQCVYGWQRDLDLAAAIVAALREARDA
jgi:hypothetical protein